jgi:beta-N-acetylhexosaminidase
VVAGNVLRHGQRLSLRLPASLGDGRPFALVAVVMLICTVTLVVGCDKGKGSTPSVTRSPGDDTSATAAPEPKPTQDPQIAALLAKMPLEDKVGQMLMYGFEGAVTSDSWRPLLVEDRVGGLVLLNSNINGPGELADFSRQVQSVSTEQGLPFGALLAVNEEGGEVLALGVPFTQFPSAATVGRAASPELARKLGTAIGEEMRAVGLNMDLAPVLDVQGDPPSPPIIGRSFGSDPGLVAKVGVAFIQGLREAGIIATAKHFPGHGSAPADSHEVLPVDGRDQQTLRGTDITPFAAAIRANVEAVMTSHVSYPALDNQVVQPATLSSQIVSGLLRDELGFDGVVITDSLTMGAITNTQSAADAAVDAVLAGVDIVLVPGTEDIQDQVRRALLDAVADGTISLERLNQSVERILRMKKQYNLGEVPALDLSAIGSEEHEAVVQDVLAEAAAVP